MGAGLDEAGRPRRAGLDGLFRVLLPLWFVCIAASILVLAVSIAMGHQREGWFLALFWTSTVLNYFLALAGTVFIATDRRLPRAQQLTWAAVTLFMGALAGIAYWWIHMKGEHQDGPPDVTRPRPADQQRR